ncbi:hypothetical protein [Spirosoma pollinicola]|uniref:Type I-PGING CRISPR-associated protein Cas8c/Csp2 n=1 Tax=Spirosoma pollinicola TaxID=2057025 RepID=A0A2K8YWT5_9BACT|nr:hypothetical protein [Spirosoma pollinicola]AUD02100.1 hypothetical protein CWM47_09885 [Spirosoma pollinicola]
MINPNNWHPYPRYGLATAMVMLDNQLADFTDPIMLLKLGAKALRKGINAYSLRTLGDPKSDTKLSFTYLSGEDVNPGSANNQSSKFGYFLAPHILTSNNAAEAIKEIRQLLQLLDGTDVNPAKSYELKRSFAPMIAKLNNGNASMANPRVGLLEATFTAIATLTDLKPSVYAPHKKDEFCNFGIIPDLPLWDEQKPSHLPLIEFVEVFKDLTDTYAREPGEDKYIATVKPDKKAYARPSVFSGNYPGAAKGGTLGAISLVAAIGRWARQENTLLLGKPNNELARIVLIQLATRPLYIVSYEGIRQESFGHHLVDLALNSDLSDINQAFNKVRLLGIDEREKFKSTNWQNFRMMSDRFLRLYTPASFQDFLAFRAEYPASLKPLIEHYMTQQSDKLSPEIIKSARAYGESLNNAAFSAATEEMEDDARRQNKPKPTSEIKKTLDYRTKRNQYKDRILTQFESTVGSAKSSAALLSQLGTIAGRLTHREIKPEAGEFMEAVLTGDISIDDAKNLITAFMRLSTFKAATSEALGVVHEDDELETAETKTITED